MKIQRILSPILSIFIFASCGAKKQAEPVPKTPEEIKLSEQQLLRKWFADDMKDSEDFPDKLNYQYYARTLGLDKDYFLSADNWEIFYNDKINLNKDIDDKSIYLIRLDPYKLLDIYAQNNNTGVEQICDFLGKTPEELYYNWGYTMTSYDYKTTHKENKCSYSKGETSVFGEDNGESRYVVMSTHILTISGNKVTYSSESDKLRIKQRDLLKSAETKSYDYTLYTDEERTPALYMDGIGISRVIPLTLLNGYKASEDKSEIVMVNMSPFSYGCTPEDKIDITIKPEETEETTISEETSVDTSESIVISETTEEITQEITIAETADTSVSQ